MEEKEDKGFVVKDRRKISLEDEPPEETIAPGEESGQAAEAAKKDEEGFGGSETAGGGADKTDRMPLPEVTFSTFVFSLSSSALVNLGEIPEPGTQSVHVDLPVAKQIIDTLGMLQEKTKGNLQPDEERLLRTGLYDLRMRYVQKSKA